MNLEIYQITHPALDLERAMNQIKVKMPYNSSLRGEKASL